VARPVAVARAVIASRSLCAAVVSLLAVLAAPAVATAQTADTCRLICELEWKVEPTWTIDNLANRHRVVTADGVTERVDRELVFETVLALDLSTRLSWLGFTVESIFAPFSDDNAVELEFETNFHWLTESRTKGWVTSHFDVIDKLSPAERPGDTSAYTHKLDLELDTAFHLFNGLREGRWLRGVEIETSLDYLATGTAKQGDVFADGSRLLDDASRWSISFVLVIPIAPF
jgi:hypothetical protein